MAGCPHRSSRLSRLVGMVVLYSMSWSSRHQQPPRPWAKESSPIAASPALVKNLHCEDCALHCSTIFYCFIRVDGPVRLLVVEDLWIMDCSLGIRVEPPSGTKLCMFLCSMPLSRRRFSTRLMGLRIVHAKLLEACSRQRARVVDAQFRVFFTAALILSLSPSSSYAR